MSSKEVLSVSNANEQKNQSDISLNRVWNGVNYKATFAKQSPNELLLILASGRQAYQFAVSNIKQPSDLYNALNKAFKYAYPSQTFPPIDHPIFSKKINQVFSTLYPLEVSNKSVKLVSKNESPPDIDGKVWEEDGENLNYRQEQRLEIKWQRNKYMIEWEYNGKTQKLYLLWRESKFGVESFVTIYHKSKRSFRGRREKVLLGNDFNYFWFHFKQAVGKLGLNLSDDFKDAFEKELWEEILKAKLKDSHITSDKAKIVFKRGTISYFVSIKNHKDKAEVFVNNHKIDTIDFDQGINGFAIRLGEILDKEIGFPRQNIRNVVLEMRDSWELNNINYNPTFINQHTFGDPRIFDDLKKLFVLTDSDIQEFKSNFVRFRNAIETNNDMLEQAFKGIIKYLYTIHSDKFKARKIDFEDIMKNWPLIYNNLNIVIYYFAHLESDFKNVRQNPHSSAKGYFQILTGDGRWKEGERAPSSFQVAVNRLYQLMSFLKQSDKGSYEDIKTLVGEDIYDILMRTSRAEPFPNIVNEKLVKMSPPGQTILAFVNFLVKVASYDFDMFLDILKGNSEAILNGYLLYHHTNADSNTLSRAQDLTIFYFPFLKQFEFR